MLKIKRITALTLEIKYALTAIMLLTVILLNSCSSVYVDLPEVTMKGTIEVDPNEEYFTMGNVYSKNHQDLSWLYKESYIYVENQEYDRYVRTLSDGTKYYAKDEAIRFVKYNPHTNTVSSLCLDPVCNHSPGSSCLMLIPEDSFSYNPQGLCGDWFMFSYTYLDGYDGAKAITHNDAYVYNLKTGESVRIFEEGTEGMLFTDWKTRCMFGNKLYSVKNVLDYSDTGYDPNGEVPMSAYEPQTKSYLGVYDFDQRKETILFEVPANYTISAVTNKRYFLKGDDGAFYSCGLDGENMTKEKNFNFSPQDFCGTYGYSFTSGKIRIYDLRTDTVKEIPIDYLDADVILTEEGLMISTFASERENIEKEWSEADRYQKLLLRHEYSAVVYLLDFDGSNPRIIYEKEKLGVHVCYAIENYFFGWVTEYYPPPDPDRQNYSYLNSTHHVIDRTTGEITPVPLLELVLVEE